MATNSAYPAVPFNEHLRGLKWRQGEHVFISGPTGSGKSMLAKSLLEKRRYVIGFGTKTHDKTLSREYKDWSIVGSLSDVESWMNRVIVWPRVRRGGADAWLANQRSVFSDAFNKLLKAEGWCVFLDELAYMAHPSFGGVGKQIEMMHHIGRSAGLSVVSLAQRPAYVPLAVISNSSHAYIARTRMDNDLKRLADLGGIDPKGASRAITALPSRHDFLYLPTQGDGDPAVLNTRR